MKRIVKRIGAIAEHAFGLRGLLVFTASALAFAALVWPEWSLPLAAGAIVVVALILLLMSVRQAEATDELRRLQRKTQGIRVEFEGRERWRVEEPTSGYGPQGPNAAAIRQSIRVLQEARQALVIEGVGTTPKMAQLQPIERSPGSGPVVTVVVACRNEASFLVDCLESVRRQTFSDWECIVVDDGSSDESLKIAHRLAESEPRFRVVRHATNSGLPAARNTGLRLARGEYVALLDADDMLFPQSIIDRLDAILAAPDAERTVGSYSGVEIGAESARAADLVFAAEWSAPLPFIDFINGSDDCPFPVHAPLVRLDAVLAVGGFDEMLRSGGEDWDLWQKLLRAGFIFVPSTLKSAVYRQRSGSMTKKLAVEHVRQATSLIERPYLRVSEGLPVSTSSPFIEPLDHYRRALLVARRAIRFGAMALVSGDRDQYEACLMELDPSSWVWLSRHVDVREVARDGIRRALGLRVVEVEKILSHTEAFERQILHDVTVRTTSEPERLEVLPRPAIDYLLVPQNRAQLDAMLSSLPAEDGLAAGVLLVDRIAGDQGVAIRTASLPLPVWSLNEWHIKRGKCRALVVGSVRDGAVLALADFARQSGGGLIEVSEPGADLMTLPEAQRDEIEVRVEAGDRIPELSLQHQFELRSDADVPGSEWDLVIPTSPESAWQIEEKGDLPFDGEEISAFRDHHKGERVVIIGNGPSLNLLDLSLLDQVPTIAVNAIFLAADRMGFDPTYYLVEDTAVMRDNVDEIRKYRAGHRFFPSIYRDLVGPGPNTSYFRMNTGFYEGRSPAFCVPRFSTDASQRLYSGQSVTIINLQLAYFMGFSEVILIGMDFSYSVPESAIVDGNRILSQGDDPNHFHPDYFGKGKVWKDPKLDRVLANYQLAKLMYESDGRRIVNATAGGKLELFERVDFNDLFGRRPSAVGPK